MRVPIYIIMCILRIGYRYSIEINFMVELSEILSFF